jgi:hypothetical protein
VDLGADALFEGIDVGDDADSAVGHTQVFERRKRRIQRVGVQRTEAFFDEEAFNASIEVAPNLGQVAGEKLRRKLRTPIISDAAQSGIQNINEPHLLRNS